MGQVPVRCVGPVAAGDQLYPSGRGDGLAVAQPHAKDEAQVLGTAMEDSDNGAEEHTSSKTRSRSRRQRSRP